MSNSNVLMSLATPPTIPPSLNIENQTIGTVNCKEDMFMNNSQIKNLSEPTLNTDACTKGYADGLGNNIIAGDGLDKTGDELSVNSTVLRTTGNQSKDGIFSVTNTTNSTGYSSNDITINNMDENITRALLNKSNELSQLAFILLFQIFNKLYLL